MAGTPAALKRRDELEVQLERVQMQRHNEDLAERQARQEAEQLAGQIAQATTLAARTGQPADTAQLEQVRALAYQRSIQYATNRGSLRQAELQVQQEIDALHLERFDEFAEHARRQSDEARAVLTKAIDAVRSAHREWAAAEASWRQILDSIDSRGPDVMEAQHRTLRPWPLTAVEDLPATVPAPGPPTYVPPKDRSVKPRPGWYEEVNGGGMHYVEDGGEVEANAPYIKPDRFGFARWRPAEATR